MPPGWIQPKQSICLGFLRAGTGIGLSHNRSLDSLMEGDVGAHSQPGQGSKFWFTATFAIGSHA